MKTRPYICIFGPTGVGKTDFAQEAAYRMGGEIINGDMGQLYAPLLIGTARPAENSYRVPHWLFGIVDEPVDYNAATYRQACAARAAMISKADKIPFVVGGTGFYMQSLLYAFGVHEKKDADAHEGVTEYSWHYLHAIDPARAQDIHPHDTYRITRALDQWKTTGVLPSQQRPTFEPIGPIIGIFLEREAADLAYRIRQRTYEMLRSGWLEECKRLKDTAWRSFIERKGFIGYRHIFSALDPTQNCSSDQYIIDTVAETIIQETIQYAKRQNTFGRMLQKKMNAHTVPVYRYNLTLSPVNLYLEHLASLVEK